jgi:hypothetical protein
MSIVERLFVLPRKKNAFCPSHHRPIRSAAGELDAARDERM